MQSRWNFHMLLVEVQNGKTTLENTLAVSCKDKWTLTTGFTSPTPSYLLKKKWKVVFTQKPVLKCLCSFMHSHQKEKTWKNPNVLQLVNEHTNCGTSPQTNYWYVQQHGWVFKAWCWVKPIWKGYALRGAV